MSLFSSQQYPALLITLILALFEIVVPLTVKAALHDPCYISNNPTVRKNSFDSIAAALENQCQFLMVSAGTYHESFTLPDHVTLQGTSSETTHIVGIITLSNDTSIQSVSVLQGGVITALDANTTLDHVKIMGSRENGLETTGLGLLQITASTIEQSTKKGISIRWGKTISIKNSIIQSNAEEGIDIRGHVSGEIIGSTLAKNGESGIEGVVAESNLIIKNNLFQENKSYQIAFQYYPYSPQPGSILIQDNIFIGNNKKTAISCEHPSGGDIPESYWTNSIIISDSNSNNSQENLVSKKCSGITAKTTKNEIGPFPQITHYEEILEQRIKIEMLARTQIEKLNESFEQAAYQWQEIQKNLQKKPSWKRWLFGYSQSEIDAIQKQKKIFINIRQESEALMQQSYDQISRPRAIDLYTSTSKNIESAEKILDEINHQDFVWWNH